MSKSRPESHAKLRVANVGGIDEATVRLKPGITVLPGRNASNRTSLLQAIAASLGSDHASVKGDADRAEVTLELAGDRYTRTLRRANGTVTTEGDAFLSDPEAADLFAFLFSWNEARRAAIEGTALREVIMRPVDTESLREEIERLETRKDAIDDQLDELNSLSARLPELERRRQELRADLGEKRSQLDSARAALESADRDSGDRKAGESALEDRLDELNDRRSSLEDARFDVRSERESIESLREELTTLREERSELLDVPEERVAEIDGEVERLRERKRAIESAINQLDQIVTFNQEVLEGERDLAVDTGLGDTSDVTEELVEDGSVQCWTCGSDVERSTIESTLSELRSLRTDRVEERNGVEEELDRLKTERDRLEETRNERDRLADRIERVESEIERRQQRLAEHETRVQDLEEAVADLEAEVERLQSRDDEETMERQREVSELEFEVESLEDDLTSVEDEIASIESRLGDREALERERESVRDDLRDARNKIDRIENEAVEAFNDHMENLLDALDYDNVDRVWIERTESEHREGRRTVTRTEFDLHVVRTTDDGVVYEDTVDHLSESERELIGLVFALAGYLAHEVYDDVPFVLLDSLEAIDSQRISKLIEYFGQYAEYLVVALLPEDAQAVSADDTITSI